VAALVARVDADKYMGAFGACTCMAIVHLLIINTAWLPFAAHTMVFSFIADEPPFACVSTVCWIACDAWATCAVVDTHEYLDCIRQRMSIVIHMWREQHRIPIRSARVDHNQRPVPLIM
jgi:hypothetical protein